MEKRWIGSLSVSVAGLGCNNFGIRLAANGTQAVVHAALGQARPCIDTEARLATREPAPPTAECAS